MGDYVPIARQETIHGDGSIQCIFDGWIGRIRDHIAEGAYDVRDIVRVVELCKQSQAFRTYHIRGVVMRIENIEQKVSGFRIGLTGRNVFELSHG